MTQESMTPIQQSNEETNSQVTLDVKSKKKIKVAVYLTEEAELAFAELFIMRFRKDRKIERSTIACEAIQALYKSELS